MMLDEKQRTYLQQLRDDLREAHNRRYGDRVMPLGYLSNPHLISLSIIDALLGDIREGPLGSESHQGEE